LAIERSYFDAPLPAFLLASPEYVVGRIASVHPQDISHEQTRAWRNQVAILQRALDGENDGYIFFEFAIPRMGRRADTIILRRGVIYLLEFKIGAADFHAGDKRQVEGYALDLKNFHLGSHSVPIVPILIATHASATHSNLVPRNDGVYEVICSSGADLLSIVRTVERDLDGVTDHYMDPMDWKYAPYQPTPTIVQAAQALYADHAVEEIARSDAGAKNLAKTSQSIRHVIARSRVEKRKSICFVTGVPGSGKTLVGLDLATSSNETERAVFLSGNGPLVQVLREALARDEVRRTGVTKQAASRKVSSFIQNIHHFRDEALTSSLPPHEQIVVFDEAQRAWDRKQTSDFMIRKRGQADFDHSEPEFLLSYMDRHQIWCVVVALIGGGQEINTGEAGLSEWRDALARRFPHWDVYFSDHLNQSEYAGGHVDFSGLPNDVRVTDPDLHLGISMRSFRAEGLSSMIHHLIAGNAAVAKARYAAIRGNYPIRLTRDIARARYWIREQSRGYDSMGIVASSGAMRLQPHGIFVKREPSITDWFLNPSEDIRSSNALEDVATEFDVQGLELDWTIVGWDADYRYVDGAFQHWAFRGTVWNRVHQRARQRYLENAYRVLLTRARQGMVIFIPEGDPLDQTRNAHWYDETYSFLLQSGIEPL
jgi:hypothetical protein